MSFFKPHSLSFLLLLFSTSVLAQASDSSPKKSIPCSGEVFSLKNPSTTALFLFERISEPLEPSVEKTTGLGQKIKSIYKTPSGEIAVLETVEIDTSGKLKRLEQDRRQNNERGVLEIRDDTAHFTYQRDGKTESDSEKATPNLVVGPWLVPHLLLNWDTLLQGKTIDVRFAVLDRKETVGFKFFKYSEEHRNGQDLIILKMKPTSIVIAAIVDPLYFYFDKKTKALVELHGRTIPKIYKDGKWQDLEAKIIYHCPTGPLEAGSPQ